MIFNPARQFHTGQEFGTLIFAMHITAEAENVRQAEKYLLGSTMFERQHFGAAISLESRGQAVGILRVLDQSFVLFSCQPRFSGAVIQ